MSPPNAVGAPVRSNSPATSEDRKGPADREERHRERRPVALVYSPGGHRAELERALELVDFDAAFHLTFASGRRPPAGERVYLLAHPRRSIARTLLNIAQSWAILRRERPAWVISSGADVAIGAVLCARLLGARLMFVESSGSLEPTLSGRIAYPLAHHFLIAWPQKRSAFPKAALADAPPW